LVSVSNHCNPEQRKSKQSKKKALQIGVSTARIEAVVGGGADLSFR